MGENMKMKRSILIILALLSGTIAAQAQNTSPPDPAHVPLFINMTSGDPWHGWMGFHFADSTLRMGHPVTIFLNLEAVKLAAKAGKQPKEGAQQREPRTILAEFIKDGGVVLMCGPCMEKYHLKMDNLIHGVQMGKPGLTQDYIFAPKAKSLTW